MPRVVGNLIVSQSDGSLSLLSPHDDTGLQITDSWHAHDFEPWIATWNYWDTNIIYSGRFPDSIMEHLLDRSVGGDDLKMKAWDIREGFTRPLLVNKR